MIAKSQKIRGYFMNDRYLYYGWNVSKNNNLYKIIDGECYTIIKNKNSYTVLSEEYRIKGLSSIMEAKEEIFKLAYDDEIKTHEYFDDPLFREMIKMGYKQLSKKYHPDTSSGDSEKMKKLNNLYEVIKKDVCQ